MIYRNKITGQEIAVASEIIGGNWEPAENAKPPEDAHEEADSAKRIRKPGRKSAK